MSMTNVTCVNYVRYPLPGTYPHFVGNYIFPIVFVVGVLGNVLNLIVLNKMHIKCKCFLSSMALADLCFFFTMFVLNLSVYDCFALSSAFLKLYYNAKVTLVVLANWFSSASIWFAIMVTIERLIAIRTPIRARTIWTPTRMTVIISVIYLLTILFQTPHFLWYEPSSVPDCSNENNTVQVLMQLPQSHQYYKLVKIAITICPMLIVTVPLILLISLNSLLVYHLRLSRKYVCEFQNFNHRSKDNERQITIMICIIVATFFVFNFPSAVVFIYAIFEKDPQNMQTIVTLSLVTNHMVILHKMFNFPLYCCSSSNFRKNLRKVFRNFCSGSQNWWIYSATDTGTNSVVNSFKTNSGFHRHSANSNGKFLENPLNYEELKLV